MQKTKYIPDYIPLNSYLQYFEVFREKFIGLCILHTVHQIPMKGNSNPPCGSRSNPNRNAKLCTSFHSASPPKKSVTAHLEHLPFHSNIIASDPSISLHALVQRILPPVQPIWSAISAVSQICCLYRQCELLPLENFRVINPEEIRVQNRLYQACKHRDGIPVTLKPIPIYPIRDVERAIQT